MNKNKICLVCKEDCLLTDTCPAEIFERSKKFMTKEEIKEEERKILRKIKLQELSEGFFGISILDFVLAKRVYAKSFAKFGSFGELVIFTATLC